MLLNLFFFDQLSGSGQPAEFQNRYPGLGGCGPLMVGDILPVYTRQVLEKDSHHEN